MGSASVRGESSDKICILSKGIHKSLKEICIAEGKIGISLPEICRSPGDLCISFADLYSANSEIACLKGRGGRVETRRDNGQTSPNGVFLARLKASFFYDPLLWRFWAHSRCFSFWHCRAVGGRSSVAGADWLGDIARLRRRKFGHARRRCLSARGRRGTG